MSRIHDALKKAEQEKQGADAVIVTGSNSLVESVTPVVPAPVAVAATSDVALSNFDAPTTTVAAAAAAAPALGLTAGWQMVLEKCPQQKWKPDPRMLFIESTNTEVQGSEEFRTLRSRLYRLREKKPLKVILVGSALPGEGKTFVSSNLAQTLARQHGRKVAVIDSDLRRAKMHTYLGTEMRPGLSEYLRGECDEFAIMRRGPMDNLVFIPGGTSVSHPAELVGSQRLEKLITFLRDIFDWVIIDSPPVVPVSDATLVARVTDGVLLVVLSASTPFDLAQRARQEFKDAAVLGVVLNRVAARSGYSSYYYGYGSEGEQAKP